MLDYLRNGDISECAKSQICSTAQRYTCMKIWEIELARFFEETFGSVMDEIDEIRFLIDDY